MSTTRRHWSTRVGAAAAAVAVILTGVTVNGGLSTPVASASITASSSDESPDDACWEDFGRHGRPTMDNPNSGPDWVVTEDSSEESADEPATAPSFPADVDDTGDVNEPGMECDTQNLARVCIMGLGHCGMEVPRYTGAIVHVSYGTKDKINNDHKIPDWIIGRAVFYGHRTDSFTADQDRTAYRFTMWEWICNLSGCTRTTKKVNIDFVIDWNDGKANHGILVTMFCRGYSGACPSWISSEPPYLGPPGPQDA